MREITTYFLVAIGIVVILSTIPESGYKERHTKNIDTSLEKNYIKLKVGERSPLILNYHYIGGMKYGVISGYDGALSIINITKDSLDCAILKEQLDLEK